MAGGYFAGLLVFGWTAAAAAQPTPRFVLSWQAPPGCPTAENVQARVDTLLGGAASATSFADVRASGEVERVDNGYRLLLSMGVGSTPSSRVIEARTCDELAGAAAIAIALLARSTMEEAPTSAGTDDIPTSSPVEERSSPAPAARPNPAPPSRKETDAEATSARVRIVLDAPVGVAGWGSLPSTGLGLGAGLGIRWKSLRAVARGEMWLPVTEQVSGFVTGYRLLSAGADACLLREVAGLELGPCVGGSVQRLVGEGVASPVFTAGSRTVLWVSGTAGIFASLPTPGFAHLRLFGQASVLISPSRPRFVIDQLGPVHEPAMAAPRVDLGCEWIF